jgi:lipopolysaccharide/colanic/teichoic acid biosynthesis glycosyltransferase
VIAVAIRLDSPGPIVFRQTRVGRHGNRFEMLKFRSMFDEADQLKEDLRHLNEGATGLFKISEDPRVTRVGRVLRRWQLDELPQLFNVFRGEMSLVGPRPLIPEEDGAIEGWYRRRLDVPPGITGHWQVLGSSQQIALAEMVKLDYLYVANWSLWSDVKLLLRTVPFIVRGRGI